VSRSSLEAAVPPNTEILLDTSVVLAYLNASEAASPAATVVIDEFVRTGRNRATISVVSVAETLVRPFAAGAAAVRIVDAFLLHFPNLTASSIDDAVPHRPTDHCLSARRRLVLRVRPRSSSAGVDNVPRDR
jgi:hypothetical protein